MALKYDMMLLTGRLCKCGRCDILSYPLQPILQFTAFSLLGQFAPWSESANKTLANLLPGTFASRSKMASELFRSLLVHDIEL